MAALLVFGSCPCGAWAACTDDFEADLCDPDIKWEACADDPEADLCDAGTTTTTTAADLFCPDDPEADLCDGTGDGSVRVKGIVSFSLPLGDKTLVEEATRISIAAHFNVTASTVSATATESRRLNAGPRRLPGLWSVAYEFSAPAAKLQAINAKLAAIASSPDDFKAAFATEFKKYLTASGVSADVVNALLVTDITAVTGTTTTATTTTTDGMDSASGAVRTQTGSAVAFLLAALFGGGAKSVL